MVRVKGEPVCVWVKGGTPSSCRKAKRGFWIRSPVVV